MEIIYVLLIIGLIAFGLYAVQNSEKENSAVSRIKENSQIAHLDSQMKNIIDTLIPLVNQCKVCKSKKYRIHNASTSFIMIRCDVCEKVYTINFNPKKSEGKIISNLNKTFNSIVYEIKLNEIDIKATKDVEYGYGPYLNLLKNLNFQYYKFDRFRRRVKYQPRIDQIKFEIK